MANLNDNQAFNRKQRDYDYEQELDDNDEIVGRCECGQVTVCGMCPVCDNEEAFHGE